MKSQTLAKKAVAVLHEKLADDILLLDLRKRSPLADWFIIATASSTVHAQALAEDLRVALKALGESPHHVEGVEYGQWVLLDYFDVVVHILISDVRQFYGLERLWGDAPRQTHSSDSDNELRPDAEAPVTGGAD